MPTAARVTIRSNHSPEVMGLSIDLAAGTAIAMWGDTDTFASIEGVSGSVWADEIYGDGCYNLLTGNGGDDVIDGRGGDDYIGGGIGNDWPSGGLGSDGLFSADGHGNDTISDFSTGAMADQLAGAMSEYAWIWLAETRIGAADFVEISHGAVNCFEKFQNHTQQVGDDVVIVFCSDDVLTLANTSLSELTEAHFSFI